MVFKLIFYYIFYCLRFRIGPWRYLNINIEYYNHKKGFYSKIDNDKLIPKKWRLNQSYLDKNNIPSAFPVFIKPEWGQNSSGVVRIDSWAEFTAFPLKKVKVPLIVQEVAEEKDEYELFYIRDVGSDCLAVLNVVKVSNHSKVQNPVNNIYNTDTTYTDITNEFNNYERLKLQTILQELPVFRIARVGVKANSRQDLLAGILSIIEINLFAPLPLGLLDTNTTTKQKNEFIRRSMQYLAKVSGTTPRHGWWLLLFLKKAIKSYQTKYSL